MKALHLITAILSIYPAVAFADDQTPSPTREFFRQIVENYGSWLDKRVSEDLQKARERARIVPRGTTPKVKIRRTGIESFGYPYFADGILFNDERITINDPPSRALEVFGSEFRTYQGHYIWDRLGIEMYTYAPGYGPEPYTKVIHTISIHLNPTAEGSAKKPMDPMNRFTGYLELDGAGIDQNSKLWEIRALVDRTGLTGGRRYIICNTKLPMCKINYFGKKRSDEVHFWTDMDHDNGKIYTVNYTFKP